MGQVVVVGLDIMTRKLLRSPADATGLAVMLNGDAGHAFEAVVDREFIRIAFGKVETDLNPPSRPENSLMA